MTQVTWIGGDECGNVAHSDWSDPRLGTVRFTINQPVDLDPSNEYHAHIIQKARTNRFFAVEDETEDDLEPLREEARAAGVKGAHLFKDADKLRAAIAETNAG